MQVVKDPVRSPAGQVQSKYQSINPSKYVQKVLTYDTLSCIMNINKHADIFATRKNKTLPRSHCTKQGNIPITEGKHKEMWLKTGSSYLPKVKGKCGQYFYFKLPGCGCPPNHRINVGSKLFQFC